MFICFRMVGGWIEGGMGWVVTTSEMVVTFVSEVVEGGEKPLFSVEALF